ncbi:MAG: site-specific integrase [Acidobacteria bacterium]|nr:site-specific integrase [Acidobacteriota bacterium]
MFGAIKGKSCKKCGAVLTGKEETTWLARIYIQGRPVDKVFPTEALAKEHLKQARLEKVQVESGAVEGRRRGSRESVTYAELEQPLYDWWAGGQDKERKAETIRGYKKDVRQVLKHWGPRPVRNTREPDVTEWVQQMRVHGLATATIRLRLIALDFLHEQAVRSRYLAQVPCKVIKPTLPCRAPAQGVAGARPQEAAQSRGRNRGPGRPADRPAVLGRRTEARRTAAGARRARPAARDLVGQARRRPADRPVRERAGGTQGQALPVRPGPHQAAARSAEGPAGRERRSADRQPEDSGLDLAPRHGHDRLPALPKSRAGGSRLPGLRQEPGGQADVVAAGSGRGPRPDPRAGRQPRRADALSADGDEVPVLPGRGAGPAAADDDRRGDRAARGPVADAGLVGIVFIVISFGMVEQKYVCQRCLKEF